MQVQDQIIIIIWSWFLSNGHYTKRIPSIVPLITLFSLHLILLLNEMHQEPKGDQPIKNISGHRPPVLNGSAVEWGEGTPYEFLHGLSPGNQEPPGAGAAFTHVPGGNSSSGGRAGSSPKGSSFDPRLVLARVSRCPWARHLALTAPDETSPCWVVSVIGVWMCE